MREAGEVGGHARARGAARESANATFADDTSLSRELRREMCSPCLYDSTSPELRRETCSPCLNGDDSTLARLETPWEEDRSLPPSSV